MHFIAKKTIVVARSRDRGGGINRPLEGLKCKTHGGFKNLAAGSTCIPLSSRQLVHCNVMDAAVQKISVTAAAVLPRYVSYACIASRDRVVYRCVSAVLGSVLHNQHH